MVFGGVNAIPLGNFCVVRRNLPFHMGLKTLNPTPLKMRYAVEAVGSRLVDIDDDRMAEER